MIGGLLKVNSCAHLPSPKQRKGVVVRKGILWGARWGHGGSMRQSAVIDMENRYQRDQLYV